MTGLSAARRTCASSSANIVFPAPSTPSIPTRAVRSNGTRRMRSATIPSICSLCDMRSACSPFALHRPKHSKPPRLLDNHRKPALVDCNRCILEVSHARAATDLRRHPGGAAPAGHARLPHAADRASRAQRAGGRARAAQGREPAARRRLQVPRRLQQGGAGGQGHLPRRRGGLLLRQPRPGRGRGSDLDGLQVGRS